MAQNEYMTEWSLLTAEKHGRLIVSGGDTVAEYYEANVGLPTLYVDETHKPFLECIITKGTFITLETLDDTDDISGNDHPQKGKTVATIADGTRDVVHGLCVLDAMRSFRSGDKFGVSFITEGYVEFPIVLGLNDAVTVGSQIAVDNMGRPVVFSQGVTGPAVGVVKAVEIIGTDAFDTGMLEYMALPYEEFMNALLRRPLELQDPALFPAPLFGYRSNLDVTDVLGAMRVQLYKL